jgi:dTDP-4-amino-4,6-dideoxygalactose transaminase
MTDSVKISQPAILGGSPAVTLDQKEANQWPVITGDDYKAVERVLNDGKLNMHPVIHEFEEDCAEYFGSKYALAHCNGTAALLACFFALDIMPGDEILVPAATFWSSVVPMLWVGAVPVFCESEAETLGIDPEDVKKKITERTKAIVAVHLWGHPCKMDELAEIANSHDLKIIEDASHSQGAVYKGIKCGSLGHMSAISLVGNKLLPGGEGGIFLTDDEALFEKAVCLGDIARIISLQGNSRRFAATGFGMKTRISSLSAAIAKSQLKYLDLRNRKRNENIEYVSTRLADFGFNVFMPSDPEISRVYFEYIIACNPDRISLSNELLVAALRAEGCTIQLPRYPLLHSQPVFQEGLYRKILRLDTMKNDLPDYKKTHLPFTEGMSRRMLRLPAFPNADKDLLDQYIAAFLKVTSSEKEIQSAFYSGRIEVSYKDLYASAENLLVI